MTTQDERRLFTRVEINLHVEVGHGEEKTFSGVVRNISLTGMFVDCAVSLPCGAVCHATVCLECDGTVTPIGVGGTIVRPEAQGAAIAFTRISPEGFGHLRRYVSCNAVNAAQIEKELARSVGLEPLGD